MDYPKLRGIRPVPVNEIYDQAFIKRMRPDRSRRTVQPQNLPVVSIFFKRTERTPDPLGMLRALVLIGKERLERNLRNDDPHSHPPGCLATRTQRATTVRCGCGAFQPIHGTPIARLQAIPNRRDQRRRPSRGGRSGSARQGTSARAARRSRRDGSFVGQDSNSTKAAASPK